MLEEVLNLPSPWNPDNIYGLIAYYRTYSRYIKPLKRRECWLETCLRVTEYSFSLVSSEFVREEEVRDFLINLYQMNFLVSGRTLWRGDKNNADATANYNCAFLCLDTLQKFGEMVYLLMEGAGVGFSIERKYTSLLPTFNTNQKIDYYYKCPTRFQGKKKVKGRDYTTINYGDRYFQLDTIDSVFYGEYLCHFNDVIAIMNWQTDKEKPTEVLISVGDSRMGWATAVVAFLNMMTLPYIDKIIVDFSEVRPAGSPLETMGGTASGHEVLLDAFKKIAWIVWRTNLGHLEPIDAMDISNCIAEAVVCGGVRRSAQICLGDMDDWDFIEAKHNLYTPVREDECIDFVNNHDIWERDLNNTNLDRFNPKFRWRTSRVLSNNSIMLYDDISLTDLMNILQVSKEFGEPGFINAKTALQRFPAFKGVNPCAEILLADRGLCNLGEIVLPLTCRRGIQLYESIRALTRHLIRITLPRLFMKEWTDTNQEYRLLGVSLCGIVDAIDDGLLPATKEEREVFYKRLNAEVWSEAVAYCSELGISLPHNCTTVKPGGTLPTLPGVSAGMHRSYAPYFYHRIRVGREHPINFVLQGLDIPISPEVGYTEENTPRWVYTIPCMSPTPIRSIDEPAIQQLERYKELMDTYCDQNVSCTISVDMEKELDEVGEWIHDNINSFVGISIFPKFDPALSPTPMPLLPFETITKQQYYPVNFSEDEFNEFFGLFAEQAPDDDEELESCETGLCPSR